VDTHLLTVALNQADGKQRNKTFAIFFRIACSGNGIKQRETNSLEGKGVLQLHRFLILYYYFNYYYYIALMDDIYNYIPETNRLYIVHTS